MRLAERGQLQIALEELGGGGRCRKSHAPP
jgi:hypothetical protein